MRPYAPTWLQGTSEVKWFYEAERVVASRDDADIFALFWYCKLRFPAWIYGKAKSVLLTYRVPFVKKNYLA